MYHDESGTVLHSAFAGATTYLSVSILAKPCLMIESEDVALAELGTP